MRLRHLLSGTSSRNELETQPAFFLRNQMGDMLSLYPTPQSRYEGWYILPEDHFIKILDRIEVVGSGEVTAITSTGQTCYWEYTDGTRLGWKLLSTLSGLTVSLSEARTLKITLDIRPIYQFPEFGRSYEIEPEEKGYLVTYSDPTLAGPVYLHIRSAQPFTLSNTWEKQAYPRDVARNSAPTELFVYTVATITTDLISFGTGSTPEMARKSSLAAAKQRPQSSPIGINYSHDTLLNQVNTAKVCVQQSLRWLQSPAGLWAGLPWFHQVWTRDELITSLGLPRDQQLEIIERYLGSSLESGELPTYIGSGTTCADGIGWLCLLVREYGTHNLTEETTHRLLNLLKTAHTQLAVSRKAPSGLIFSGHNATWMDTIGRSGYRIDIQCMYSLMLEILYEISEDPTYEQERLRLRGSIKSNFLKNGYLSDGVNDPSLRPNLFLAYLLQPDLLTANVWQECFDIALKELRTAWGGLTSLAPSHPDFHPFTTGEDNQSYHNGDSWFFINNLAAMALIRFNQHRYGKVIVDILQGSTEEILWHNFLGHPGEISSASTLDSYGCGIQGFSGGTYLALLQEFENYSATHERESISFFWDATADSTADSFLR